MNAILGARGLSCERGGRVLWRDWDFELPPGSLWRASGPNGSGKSTLLRVLAGLHRGWRGQLRGADRLEVVYVGHTLGLKSELDASRNLRYFQAAHFIAADPAAAANRERALSAFGLEGRAQRRPLRRLSAGQRQRVALARLLLRPAKLWLLDEPFASLDGEGARRLRAMLAAHAAAGGAAVIAEPSARPEAGPQASALSLETLELPRADIATGDEAGAARAVVGGLWSPLTSALGRDARLLRLRGVGLRGALFLLLTVLLLSLAAPAGATPPAEISAAMLWALALLTMLVGGDELAASDLEDGSLDQRLLAPAPLWMPALARMLALWAALAVPLALAMPVAGLMLNLPPATFVTLAVGVAVGGFGLAALAAAGAALLAPATRAGMLLLPLLLLPLALPAPVFGIAAARATLIGGAAPLPSLAGLAAWSLAALGLLPLAVAAAWRLHRE